MAGLIQQLQDNVLRYITPAIIFPVLLLAAIFCFFAYYWYAMCPKEGTLEWISMASRKPRPFTFAGKRHPMTKKDALPLLLLTAVYAFSAFWSLGSFTAPQSFAQLAAGSSATFSLKEEADITSLMYYTGLNTGAYTLEASADGENWVSLWAKTDDGGKVESYYWADGTGYSPSKAVSQKYSLLFKWQEIVPTAPVHAKFLRITAIPDSGKDWLELGELALYGADGELLQVAYTDGGAAALFDEQGTVPAMPTWYNSGYFDEIYHPRTAYEHIRGIYPYEITHPPLGKLIMSLGIQIFGMTPFGWRFMGALFGVGMLPLLYVFLKNLFGKTAVAACGTALFAFDFMHLTQTRIATIDTYGVFFILAMYFFMYRYLTLPAGTSFKKGALPLFLSGLMWGIGAASKWTVIYGAAGLALLYFIGLYFKLRDWPQDEGAPRFGPWLVKTLLFSVLCFVLIPAVIYTLSYIPYALARDGLTLENLIRQMWENQKYMLTYHQGVHDVHPYESRWYQWLVDGRPILYYLDSTSGASQGLKCAFASFNNPVVSWAGLLAILACAAQAFRRKWAKASFFLVTAAGAVTALVKVNGILDASLEPYVRTRNLSLMILGVVLYLAFGALAIHAFPQYSAKALFIVVGYLSQLVPWLLIGRTTFAYHYFPSVIFLVLAICYVFNDLMERRARGWRIALYGLTGTATALYAAFYPVLVGIMVPTWYTDSFIRWLPSWPF